MDAKEIVDGAGELRAELKAIIRNKSSGASPQKNVKVDEDIGGAFGDEFGHDDDEYVGAAAEAVREEEDVGFAAGHGRQRFEIVDAYYDAGAIGEGHGVDGSAHRVPGDLASLTLQAVAEPPSDAKIHPDPPGEAFEHGERAL